MAPETHDRVGVPGVQGGGAEAVFIRRLSERQFMDRVTAYCDLLRLTWHHETDSRKSKKGFPDLVIIGNAVVFAELKSQRGKVTKEQAKWLTALRTAGAEAYVWRPTDWDFIYSRLRVLAGKPLIRL